MTRGRGRKRKFAREKRMRSEITVIDDKNRCLNNELNNAPSVVLQ